MASSFLPSPTMPRHIRDFHVTSARKFKLNNDVNCSDKKKNGRDLQTVCMFSAITSLLVKDRKSLHMAFEDDTSVENMRPFLWFYQSQNQSQILFEFGSFQGVFCMGENFEAKFFFARALDQKVCIWLWPCAAWDGFMPSFEWNWWFKVVAKCNFRFLHYSSCFGPSLSLAWQ